MSHKQESWKYIFFYMNSCVALVCNIVSKSSFSSLIEIFIDDKMICNFPTFLCSIIVRRIIRVIGNVKFLDLTLIAIIVKNDILCQS